MNAPLHPPKQSPAPSAARKPLAASFAKAAAFGAAASLVVSTRFVDIALISSGIAAAVGSVAFAGAMLMQGDHPPNVNGMQYLAIFARPSSGTHMEPDAPSSPAPAPEQTQVAAAPQPSPTLDMAPTGAIGPKGIPARSDYELVAAQPERAWLRAGERILAIHPGDDVPGLGKVREIALIDGRWALLGENDGVLLIAGEAAGPKGKGGLPQKRMIFNDQ